MWKWRGDWIVVCGGLAVKWISDKNHGSRRKHHAAHHEPLRLVMIRNGNYLLFVVVVIVNQSSDNYAKMKSPSSFTTVCRPFEFDCNLCASCAFSFRSSAKEKDTARSCGSLHGAPSGAKQSPEKRIELDSETPSSTGILRRHDFLCSSLSENDKRSLVGVHKKFIN